MAGIGGCGAAGMKMNPMMQGQGLQSQGLKAAAQNTPQQSPQLAQIAQLGNVLGGLNQDKFGAG